MNQERFTAVDQYLDELFVGQDEALERALQRSAEAGLPAISVSPTQGKFLSLLARMCRARRILEIGTLGGYSAIWLARALPQDGQLVSLEYEPRHAAVARANIADAGFAGQVTVHEGRALDLLSRLEAQHGEPFDFVFIDADKDSYTQYLEWSIRLARSGATIVADNVIRDGAVVNAGSRDAMVQGVRRFNATLAADPRVSGTALQLVGSKGYDGMAIAVVL